MLNVVSFSHRNQHAERQSSGLHKKTKILFASLAMAVILPLSGCSKNKEHESRLTLNINDPDDLITEVYVDQNDKKQTYLILSGESGTILTIGDQLIGVIPESGQIKMPVKVQNLKKNMRIEIDAISPDDVDMETEDMEDDKNNKNDLIRI